MELPANIRPRQWLSGKERKAEPDIASDTPQYSSGGNSSCSLSPRMQAALGMGVQATHKKATYAFAGGGVL